MVLFRHHQCFHQTGVPVKDIDFYIHVFGAYLHREEKQGYKAEVRCGPDMHPLIMGGKGVTSRDALESLLEISMQAGQIMQEETAVIPMSNEYNPGYVDGGGCYATELDLGIAHPKHKGPEMVVTTPGGGSTPIDLESEVSRPRGRKAEGKKPAKSKSTDLQAGDLVRTDLM